MINAATSGNSKLTDTQHKSGLKRPENSQKLNIGREFMDVSWRIAVPVTLFAALGIVADRQFGSAPFATIAAMIVGLVFAGLLVKRQIDKWPATMPKPGSYERNRRPGDKEDDSKGYFDD